MPTNSNPKIIVAVHGVGDQVLSETVQTVINRFCRYHGEAMGVPLGKIKTISKQKNPYEQEHADGQTSPDDYSCKPFRMSELGYGGELGKLSFIEVHWADLARQVDENRFMLESPKSWSKTIIERLPKRYEEAEQLSPKEFGRLRLLLREMLETIKTLQNLFKVADLAGVFKFDMAGVLNAYLGDVQIVAEFDDVRRKILKRFKDLVKELSDGKADADIYIVAHSEGTVVTLLSLLEAMAADSPPRWIKQIRGVMTIGSPLDKHLLLWRELFEPGGVPMKPSPKLNLPDASIEWRNYYDNGDPIGFELEGMRRWLHENKWTAFNFRGTEDLTESEESKESKTLLDKCKDQMTKQVNKVIKTMAAPVHDFGFTRYYFPGKAHNDYWDDSQVFGHFIQTVVYKKELENATKDEKDRFMPKEDQFGKKPVVSAKPKPKKNKLNYSNPPKTKRHAQLISYCAPYLLLMVMMFAGVFVLYKAVKVSVAGDTLEAVRHGLSPNQQDVLKESIPDLKGDDLKKEVKAICAFVEEKRQNAIANCFSCESSDALRNALEDYRSETGSKLSPKTAKAVVGAAEERAKTLFWNVLGITFLLAGMTVLARIPRLALTPKWIALAVAIFGLGAAGYWRFAWDDERAYLGRGICAALNWLSPSLNVGATWGLILLAAVLVILSLAAEYFYPKWGLRMLLIFGGLGVVAIIAPSLISASDLGPIWPVILATAFALYLWQTVALTFDLVFVWHRYVRHWRELGFSKWRPKRA